MSSTTNVQNFLVNVFRPVYTYDSTTTLFTPKLELSNIDNYSGNTLSVFTAAVGDSNSNVYVGSNAGNPYTTVRACRNVTAIGFGAGSNISNVSNSTYLGYYAGQGALSASSVVAVGANANGNGTSNVYVGTGTGGAGSSNVFLGSGLTGSGSGSILIGTGLAAGASNSAFRLGPSYLVGDMSAKWLGLGTTAPYDSNNKMDISGNLYVFGQQGINMVPIRTLDVNGNFRASDANGTLDFNLGVTKGTGGFASTTGTLSNMTIGQTSSIGTMKKGVITVTAQDTATSNNYQSIMVHCPDPTDGSTIATLTSNAQLGSVYVIFQTSGSNIQVSNAISSKTVSWSITYFPLP